MFKIKFCYEEVGLYQGLESGHNAVCDSKGPVQPPDCLPQIDISETFILQLYLAGQVQRQPSRLARPRSLGPVQL